MRQLAAPVDRAQTAGKRRQGRGARLLQTPCCSVLLALHPQPHPTHTPVPQNWGLLLFDERRFLYNKVRSSRRQQAGAAAT